jgi:hypothetical protein
MITNDKKEFVLRVGLHVAAYTTQVHAAAQQQPAAQATEIAATAPADTPVPGNKSGAILRTLLSANAAQQGRAPAGSTTSATFEGRTCSCQVTKVQYSVDCDITSESLGSLMTSGANGGVTGEDMLILSIIKHSKVDIFAFSDTAVLDLTLCQAATVITMEVVEKLLESSTSMQTWEREAPCTTWFN